MAKYRHHPDTLVVLNDLINRVRQLIEASEHYRHHDAKLIDSQIMVFDSVLTLLEQVKDNGHVMRGNNFFPDPIEEMAKTKWNRQPQLNLSEHQ